MNRPLRPGHDEVNSRSILVEICTARSGFAPPRPCASMGSTIGATGKWLEPRSQSARLGGRAWTAPAYESIFLFADFLFAVQPLTIARFLTVGESKCRLPVRHTLRQMRL